MKIPTDMKKKLTPEFFEFWCEYAEGFEYQNFWQCEDTKEKIFYPKEYIFTYNRHGFCVSDILKLSRKPVFCLFIHRACDGWTIKKEKWQILSGRESISIYDHKRCDFIIFKYEDYNNNPELTRLAAMIYIYDMEKKNERI